MTSRHREKLSCEQRTLSRIQRLLAHPLLAIASIPISLVIASILRGNLEAPAETVDPFHIAFQIASASNSHQSARLQQRVDALQDDIACARHQLLLNEKKSEALATTWLVSNIRDNGLFHYFYDVERDQYPNRNNELRQLMSSRLLAELADEQPELLDLHHKNLIFVFRHWYRETNGVGYIKYNGKSKLGANAMALRTLSVSPLRHEYQSEAKALCSGILVLMNQDGSFRPWLIEPSYAYDADYLLTFYSGEAILALVDYHKAIGDEQTLAAAIRAQEYYLRKYVGEIEENYYPAYVPWHTQSLHGLFEITGDRRYADAALFLNDKLLELLDTTSYVGRFYNPATPRFGTPHSSSDGVYTESLAHAYAIARTVGDAQRADRYLAALDLAVGNLHSLQYDAESAEVFGTRPEQLIGGIRISATNTAIRLDNVQHAIDAYRAIMKALEEE